MQNPNSTNWLILPDSRLHISILQRPAKLPLVEITGNPRGMVSIANIFLWLASPATDFDSISITALPFVITESSFGLTALLVPENEVEAKRQGKLIRLDKAMQYEWQAAQNQMIDVALQAHHIGCTPEKGYFDLFFSDNSDADMLFELTSNEQ